MFATMAPMRFQHPFREREKLRTFRWSIIKNPVARQDQVEDLGPLPPLEVKTSNNEGSMEPIRYKTGEAIRWLKTGADAIRKEAMDKGRQVVHSGTPKDAKDVGGRMAAAAGAVMDFGKSAWAELKHAELEHTEYVLTDEGFDIVKGASIKSIP